jgi:hypothetical protein
MPNGKMTVRTKGHCGSAAHRVIRLENPRMHADILPDFGAKIWSLVDKATGTEWIWRNPHVGLQRPHESAGYDDHWSGGWEELFPNDAECSFQGRRLPDHGEWWSRAWDCEETERCAQMTLRTASVPAYCEKTVSMDPEAARMDIRYRIRNLDDKPLRFLFKQHLPIAVTPHHRLELPGGTVLPIEEGFGTRIVSGGGFTWPLAPGPEGRRVNLEELPSPEHKHRDFLCVRDLPAGWCGVRDSRTGRRIRLHFPLHVFPFTWLFMTFGGWRDLYTVVLEPCTNMPKDLGAALKNGTCAELLPGGTLECQVSVELS